ncbi:hypothetical protein AMATHDRAFT_44843 [Amanita thiersii Skay4041]|uniref:Uncharacterized protein n=1 Tax=Amanita thiersii Skay4041 TaxID=703135 RepID=A0A2A9NXS9_9AGAR|nr:hypothetical protein AMATHDRAFT_44843 [Amanita thiersii Skay4041]
MNNITGPKPRALSLNQERKLVDYLDEKFLELMRGFKKRSEPTSPYRTLSDYLAAARQILSFVLQIPPIDPSTSLRTAYLLRLTNDVLNSVPGYAPTSPVLHEVVDWLDDLDQAWLAVLQTQVWDPEQGVGRDLVIDAGDAADGVKSTPMSQTEVARLRSLLVGGVASLEEWLSVGMDGEEIGNVERMLGRLGLQNEFDEVFSGTLDYLGGFGGYVVEPLSELE